MVASQDVHASRMPDLESEQKADRLDALPSTIHVITQEEVARLWRHSAILKQSQHVVVLTMDIAADLKRS